MKVAKTLAAAGFDVLQSSFYTDPETGTSREIDVIGRLSNLLGFVFIYPIIECKKSSKPWVIFTSDCTSFNRIRSFAIMTVETRKSIIETIFKSSKMLQHEWFVQDGRVGFGITEAFTSREDTPFKAGLTSMKGSIAQLKKDTESNSLGNFAFYFPTVVLDGRQFECFLGEDQKTNIKEISSTFLLFPIEINKLIGSGIRVVTLNAFDAYCNDLLDLQNLLWNELQDEIKELGLSMGIEPEIFDEFMKTGTIK